MSPPRGFNCNTLLLFFSQLTIVALAASSDPTQPSIWAMTGSVIMKEQKKKLSRTRDRHLSSTPAIDATNVDSRF